MSVQQLDILHPQIARYLRRLPTSRDPVLEKMEQQADRDGFPMIGPQVGQLLMVLTRAIGARRVFEMGSGFGYSGVWFAKALPADGRVTLTDTSAVHLKHARLTLRYRLVAFSFRNMFSKKVFLICRIL